MRQIQVLVSEEELEPVVDLLEEEEIDFVRQQAWVGEEEQWLLSFPVPTDAIGYLLRRLDEVGVDVEQYTVVSTLETAMTPRSEPLMERFASDFDPLSRPEIRSKARDMSHDPRSFMVLIAASAIIATAGLLVESFAVVVGSMVIAPLVGPVMTAAVGAATGDRKMVVNSVWLQVAGLGLAVAAAAAFSLGLRASGFVPGGLDVAGLESVAVRVAPGLLSVAVAIAAGAASAFGLATKGPTALIGVMIAAALIPAAAAVGVAAAWVEPRVAVGAFLLLVLSTILINVGAYAVLFWLGYRPEGRWLRRPSASTRRRLVVFGTTVVVLALVVAVVAGSYQQISYERTINREVEGVLASPEYASVAPVTVRIQYAGVAPFASPETVTVAASWTGPGEPPELADLLARRIQDATGHDVVVRVRFVEYQRSDGSARSALAPGSVQSAAVPAVDPGASKGTVVDPVAGVNADAGTGTDRHTAPANA